MRLWTIAVSTVVLLCTCGPARGGASGAAHPLDRLAPGHWMEVPDSQMIKVAFEWPKDAKKHGSVVGTMRTWSGGAYDTKRDRLIIWGGGHNNYAGNEIYVFDVRRLKWERLNDPTLDTDPEARLEQTGLYSDGKPRSFHTRDYLEYVPTIDRFCSLGVASPFPRSRRVLQQHQVTWAFDFDAKKWEKKARPPFHMIASAWDPVAGRAWARARAVAYIACWDPLKDVWATRSKRLKSHNNFRVSGVIDPVGRRFLAIGGEFFFAYDIGAEGMLPQKDIVSKGPQDIVSVPMGAAMDYDPVADKLVCWKGGADVFTLDLASMTWEKVPPAAGNAVIPTDPEKRGTYGRWRYIPSKNAYIVVNSVKGNVYFYRLTRRAGQPIPRRFVEALKEKDAALVKWAAGQVALWPKAKSEPVLKAALSAQNGAAAEAVRKTLDGLR